VADREHPNRPLPPCFVDDPVGTDAQRVETTEPTAELGAGGEVVAQVVEGFDDGVGEWLLEANEGLSGAPRQEDAGQSLPAGVAKLALNVIERVQFPALGFASALVECTHRFRVGQDLGRLLERRVLVDRNEHGGRRAVARDRDVLALAFDLVQESGQLLPEAPNWNRASHREPMYLIAYATRGAAVPG
jgi:hypothetical protein